MREYKMQLRCKNMSTVNKIVLKFKNFAFPTKANYERWKVRMHIYLISRFAFVRKIFQSRRKLSLPRIKKTGEHTWARVAFFLICCFVSFFIFLFFGETQNFCNKDVVGPARATSYMRIWLGKERDRRKMKERAFNVKQQSCPIQIF